MQTSFEKLLRVLVEHEVAFVVVGGVAAILEGAPMTTLDLDVVYDVNARNLSCLADALQVLDARYRDPAGRVIAPTAPRLSTHRVNLLDTRFGILDVLQEIGQGWSYRDLLPRSIRMKVWDLEVLVLELSATIESKKMAGRPKDDAQLPILEETLRAKKSGHLP